MPNLLEKINHKKDLISEKAENYSLDFIEFLASNYSDDEGNLLGYKDFDLLSHSDFEKKINRIKSIQPGSWDNDLDNFICRPENADLILKEASRNNDYFNRVKYLKIFHDSIESMMDLSYGDAYGRFSENDKTRLLLDFTNFYNQEDNYFIKMYSKILLNDLASRYLIDDADQELIKQYNQDNFEFLQQHSIKYDDKSFVFSDRMINKLNLESRDYGSPSSLEESFEAVHYSPKANVPGTNNGYGDYITIDLAPDLVGVYAMDGSLIGYNDISDNSRSPIILNETIKLKDRIKFSKYPEDLTCFKILSSLQMRSFIKRDFGINLSDYNLRTQYQFLNFIKTANSELVDRVKIFLKNADSSVVINRVESFLSLEEDFSDGERILSIAENNPKISDSIYAKISEILNLVVTESDILQKNIFNNKGGHVSDDIHNILLKKVHEIIMSSNDKEIIEQLIKNETEIHLLSAALKSLDNKEAFSLSDLNNISLDIKGYGTDISQKDKLEIIDMAKLNWRQNELLKNKVVSNLENCLKNGDNQKYYILRYKDKIISFVRFEKKVDRLHAASFNVVPGLKGVGIGEKMVQASLVEEAKHSIIEATVSPRLKIGTNYVNQVGFNINGYIKDYQTTGEPLFAIELNIEENDKYLGKKTKEYSNDFFVRQAVDSLNKIDFSKDTVVFCCDMSTPEGFVEMDKVMRKLLVEKNSEGENVDNHFDKYIITRYFIDKNGSRDLYYYVFEKKS